MKKLMSVLLAAALMLTAVFAFTACGDAEDAPGTANAGSTSAAEDKTPADTAETLEDGSVISTKEYLLRTWTSVKIAFSSLTLEERNDFQDHMGVRYDVYRNICDNLTID